mmetsp:Transcript_3360/g.12223  ORF Transcript_3360/g.12223 Transcript_3360/m.12223 type:complete len:232 (-) Transcript_3360:628-1323(-)
MLLLLLVLLVREEGEPHGGERGVVVGHHMDRPDPQAAAQREGDLGSTLRAVRRCWVPGLGLVLLLRGVGNGGLLLRLLPVHGLPRQRPGAQPEPDPVEAHDPPAAPPGDLRGHVGPDADVPVKPVHQQHGLLRGLQVLQGGGGPVQALRRIRGGGKVHLVVDGEPPLGADGHPSRVLAPHGRTAPRPAAAPVHRGRTTRAPVAAHEVLQRPVGPERAVALVPLVAVSAGLA